MDDTPPPPLGHEAVEAALLSRRSVRAFLPRPVPAELLARLLTLAARAPSNSNTQPWHVHVLTGEPKRRLAEAIVRELEANGRAAETEYPYQPGEWQEPFLSRRRSFGQSLYLDQLGIPPGDAAGRHAHHIRNYDFFGAPVGLIVTVGRNPLAGALIDAGLFLQGLATAARAHGLDTCLQASFIDFHPIIRRHLRIPDDRFTVCGVSLGYADREHCLDLLRTEREPLSAFVTFHTDDSPTQP
ncbi:nitroreductase [Roseomonas populi]|uniref:Nitroreductase n=1 Tax=Roseomonas populi TaxID=3121582 RepID=A0ABT1XB67_9PROT|nr:nitroreductase [Roseomonas pecuniae]MCR0984939.1 nitroreductase [Roseomonas pecuniae]